MNNDNMNYDIEECDEKCEILKALGHPVRLKMVALLRQSNHCSVNSLAERLGLPQSTTSQHLAVLRKSGVIAGVKEGVTTYYRIKDSRALEILRIFS